LFNQLIFVNFLQEGVPEFEQGRIRERIRRELRKGVTRRREKGESEDGERERKWETVQSKFGGIEGEEFLDFG
jgi:hypothetical protein